MFGGRIAALRSKLGWSQAELARRLNISPSTVGMYEQGRREPSIEMVMLLSEVLGVSIEFLVSGRSICPEDQLAQVNPAGKSEEAKCLVEALKHLSRDELLVLLTAEMIG